MSARNIKPNVVAAGMAVAQSLRAAETAIDQALIAAADLNGIIPRARIDAEVAAECGHRAMEQASQSLQLLMEARSKMVTAHRMLAKTSDGLGFEPHAFGGAYGKPETGLEQQAPTLRLASAA